jgi:hypothetical protein
MTRLLSSDRRRSLPPRGSGFLDSRQDGTDGVPLGVDEAAFRSAFRLRLAVFADVALALTDALEASPAGASFVNEAGAVWRAFGHVPPPPDEDHGLARQYRLARDIATADCEFVLWAGRQSSGQACGGPDLVCRGYARWIREELGLLRT